MRNIRNNKGFTLIELMIVVVIIGILAAIAIPKFSNVGNSAKEKEASGIVKQIYTLAESYRVQKGAWPGTGTNGTGSNARQALDSTGFEFPAAKHYDTLAAAADVDISDGSVCLLPISTETKLRAVAMDTLGRIAYSTDVGSGATCPTTF